MSRLYVLLIGINLCGSTRFRPAASFFFYLLVPPPPPSSYTMRPIRVDVSPPKKQATPRLANKKQAGGSSARRASGGCCRIRHSRSRPSFPSASRGRAALWTNATLVLFCAEGKMESLPGGERERDHVSGYGQGDGRFCAA